MAGVSEHELDRMLEAAANDPAARPVFMDALLESDVCVLGTYSGEIAGGVTQHGGSASLVALEDEAGIFTPFFTSERALQETLATLHEADPNFLRFNCRGLFEMTLGSRLLLNPNSEFGKEFLPDEIEAVLAGEELGVEQHVLHEGETFGAGPALQVPPELPALLSRFFATRPVVSAAHLGWIVHADGDEGYLLVIVAADAEHAMHGFGSLALDEIIGDETLDVTVAVPGDRNLLAAVPPFYTRA